MITKLLDIVGTALSKTRKAGCWKWWLLHPPDAIGKAKPYMRPKEFYTAIGEGVMNVDLSHVWGNQQVYMFAPRHTQERLPVLPDSIVNLYVL